MRIEEEKGEDEDKDEKSVRGAPFYEYFKSRMISFIFVLIVAVAYFAFGGSQVLFDMSSTHGSNHRCGSISLASAAVERFAGMFAPADDPNAGLLRQCVFCSSASHHSSNEAAPSCLYSSDAMTAMAVNDSKYENDESIELFGFGRSEVPELLREGCGRGKFQGHYIAAPRYGLQAQEGKVSDLECLFIYCVVRKREERFFKVTSFLFVELMLIGLGYPFFLFSFFCNLCYTIFLAGKASTAR